MSTKLFVGLKINGVWFKYANVIPIKGGGLAVLDGADNTGGARLLNLIKKSVISFANEAGEEHILTDMDYMNMYIADAWKIAREAMKKINGKENLIFSEFFYCDVCSSRGNEKYTEVKEDWDDLIEQGLIDAIYLEESEEPYYWTELPLGIEIASLKTLTGGTFNRIKRELITIGKTIKLQKNKWASETEANSIFATWDASIIEVEGMGEREFNMFVRRNPSGSFCKQYLVYQEDQDAMSVSEDDFKVGIVAYDRSITCKHCHNEIGGYLDFTNFFQSLLPKKSARKR